MKQYKNILLLLVLLLIILSSCSKESNPDIIDNYFFGCYDPTITTINKSEYNGIPTTCSSIVLSDDFNNNDNNWHTATSGAEEGVYSVANGNYEVKASGEFISFILKLKSLGTDDIIAPAWEIEALSSTPVNSKIENPFSIIFGGLDWNYYLFGIGSNGNFSFLHHPQKDVKPTVLNTNTSPQLLDLNKLTIRFIDGDLFLFVNEVLVHSATNITLFGNQFGFSFPSNCQVKIDRIEVRKWNI